MALFIERAMVISVYQTIFSYNRMGTLDSQVKEAETLSWTMKMKKIYIFNSFHTCDIDYINAKLFSASYTRLKLFHV